MRHLERYRLKNIIILILVLLNAFLLGSLLLRNASQYSSEQAAVEQLVALFSAADIQLDAADIPQDDPPTILSVSRSEEEERRLAEFLLDGQCSYSDQGGIVSYENSHGVVVFRSGSFDAAGTLAADDAVSFCESFCKKFFYDDLEFSLDAAGSGTAIATRSYGKLPVFNCSVTFTFDRGTLMTVSGTFLSSLYTETPSEQMLLHAPAALDAFLQFRQETAAVVSSVSDISLAYELQNASGSAMTLVPVWRINTNASSYYVNCSSGIVSLA